MPTPTPVGLIHFDEPRAVQVREPENLSAVHSAIHCGVNVYTDSKKETDYLLERWPEIMQELSDSIQQVIDNMDP